MDIVNYIATSWQIWIIIITGFLVIYKYTTRNYGYWEQQGVPSEKGYPIIGSEFSVFRKPVHEVDLERCRKHGRFYGTYINGACIFNVYDPDIVKMILVKDFPVFVNRQTTRSGLKYMDSSIVLAVNDDWKRIRSVMSPTFTSGKIKKMAPMVNEIANRLTQKMIEVAEQGKAVNVKRIFSNYSIEVLASCAFGIKFDTFENPDHPFVVKTRKITEAGVLTLILLTLITILPKWTSRFKTFLLELLDVTYFVNAAREVINQRMSLSKNSHVDFLQLLIDAKDNKLENTEADKLELNDIDSDGLPGKKSPYGTWTKTLDEDEIVAQCAIFLLVGHDTIATTLGFITRNLALNPDLQEILLKEIDEAWEKHGEMDFDIVNKMSYLNAVIFESSRIHTFGLRLMRQAKEEYTIPNTSITLPKDCIISIPVYSMHLDPEFFPDPYKFEPDRFLPENKDNIKPYTFMPFGEGPRNCIAMRFALMELKLCLALLLRHVKFVATIETKMPLEFNVGKVNLEPKKIMVRPVKRTF